MSGAARGRESEGTVTCQGDFLVIAIVPIDRKRSAGITITIFTEIGNCIINLQSPLRHPGADTYIAIHHGQGRASGSDGSANAHIAIVIGISSYT